MSDVKLFGGYVELGLDAKRFDEGLAAARKRFVAFGEALQQIGAAAAGLGAAIAAPLAASAKMFADYGKTVGNLSAQTGISAQALAGLGYAAQKTGLSMESVGSAVRFMQRNIVSGSKESADAFARLGMSAASLRGLSADEQFEKIADAMSQISDPALRADTAMKIFGRSGAELLPLLDQGSEGIARMNREARTLGLVLGEQQTQSARQLSSSFERLEGATRGLAMQIGAALAPAIKPVIDRLVDLAVAARLWIEQNPEFIVGLAKIATTFIAVGGAALVLGAAISAAMSPLVLTVGALIAVGSAVLAVTDALGVTSTGFGELFNSIRIGGTGLGTWLAAFWIWIERGFNGLVAAVGLVGLTLWDSFQFVITKLENAMMAVFQFILSGVKAAIEAFNYLVPKSQQVSTNAVDNLSKTMQHERDIGNAQIEDRAKRRENWLVARGETDMRLEKQSDDLFRKDPQTNTGLFSIDTSRAKGALAQIGGNIWSTLAGGADGLLSKLNAPHIEFPEMATKPEAQTTVPMFGGGNGKGDVLGTFNGMSAGQLGVGTSVADRIARAVERTAENTDPRNEQVTSTRTF